MPFNRSIIYWQVGPKNVLRNGGRLAHLEDLAETCLSKVKWMEFPLPRLLNLWSSGIAPREATKVAWSTDSKDRRHRKSVREEVTGGPECVFEMPEGGNTAKEVERGVSLENQQKPLKYVPFIFKFFPVWKIAYQVHKTAWWLPSKILPGVDSCRKLLVSKGGWRTAVTRLRQALSCLRGQRSIVDSLC